MRRGRGEAAPVSAGALGGPRGPYCAPPAATGSFPYPSLFSEPSAATSPRLCPFPPFGPPGPRRGAAPALSRCYGPAWPRARLVRCSRGRSGPAPAAPRGGPGPGQALAPPRGPGAGWACPALSRSRSCSAVDLADCSSVPFSEIPVLCPRLWASPLRFPAPRRSVPELPSQCPGLRVLLRLGRRWRGPAARGGRSRDPASQPRRVCGPAPALSTARFPVQQEGSVLSPCLLCVLLKREVWLNFRRVAVAQTHV